MRTLPRLFSVGILLILLTNKALGQSAPNKYWVRLKDKVGTPHSVSQPHTFLSAAAIERRDLCGVQIDQSDLPLTPAYLQQIAAIPGVTILHKSKWFNSVSVYVTDTLLIDDIMALNCVAEIRNVERYKGDIKPELETFPVTKSGRQEMYGPSFNQIAMLNGHMLHQLGFDGKGMDVAVLDAGFTNVDQMPVFQKMRDEGRLVPVWDFVDNDNELFHGSAHGTFVLSIIGGWMPDSLIGAAPGARFFLFRTEDTASEYMIEEDNWVAAAEMADSLGVKVFNTSLGYSYYDDPNMSHTYASMDGNTARITRGADMAASKGIVVVNSAGNSGAGTWKFITAPADGHRVMAVGAVGPNRERAWFSSYGPSYDGRVKPNVMAQGHQTVFANMNGGISIGNGTSFSGPIIAGMAACLWQLHPAKTSFEIHDAIEQSAHLYTNPNDSLGHGIPDFWKAHRILKGDNPEEASLELSIFPNPFTDDLRLVFRPGKFERIRLEVFDSMGRLVREFDEVCTIGPYVIHHLGPEMRSLPSGSYILNCLVDGIPYFTKRVLKG